MPLKYKHTQKGSRLLYGFAVFLFLNVIVVEALIYFLAGRGPDALPHNQLLLIMVLVPLIPVVVLGWAFVLMSSLTVMIDETAVRLRFGCGMWRKTIQLDKVSRVRPVNNTIGNGWGIHYIGNRCWLYNIAGMDAVELRLTDGKKVRIGTDEPEQLAEAVRTAIS